MNNKTLALLACTLAAPCAVQAASPVVTSTPVTTAVANQLYQYDITVTDADLNDIITISAATLPSWLSLYSNPASNRVAGTGASPATNGTSDSPDGTAATAALINAAQMSVDANGLIFFSDTEEYGIRYIDAQGNIQTFLAGDGQYTTLNPIGVVHDPAADVVYVAEYSAWKVIKIDNTGTRTDVATGILWPESLLLDSANNRLFVSSGNGSSGGLISVIDLSNNAVTTLAGTGTIGYSDTGDGPSSQICDPRQMALDGAGNLLFSDRGNRIIRKVNLTTKAITTIAGSSSNCSNGSMGGDGGLAVNATFEDPSGLAIDNLGNIYVGERLANVVRRITTDGNINAFMSVGGSAESLAIAPSGILYVQSINFIARPASPSYMLYGTPGNWNAGSSPVALNVTDGVNKVTHNFTIDVKALHMLRYRAGWGGTLTGTTTQTVVDGASGSTVTAVPGIGAHFVDWSDGLGTAARTDSNVSSDIDVTANFAPDTYQVTATAGIGGSVTPGTQTIDYGGSAIVTVTTDPGYVVETAGGTCGGALSGDTYETAPVTAACSVAFTFKPALAVPFLAPWAMWGLGAGLIGLGAGALRRRFH